MGQAILVREYAIQVSIIYEGQARLLGYDPRTQTLVTLKLLRPGEVLLGWSGTRSTMRNHTAYRSCLSKHTGSRVLEVLSKNSFSCNFPK